jgi:hypothetical protein
MKGLADRPLRRAVTVAARAVCFLVVAALPSRTVNAADILVNSNNDVPDAAEDGVCETTGNVCSLRAAVQTANETPGEADVIRIRAGTYVLDEKGDDDTAVAGDLDVLGPVTIEGDGAARARGARRVRGGKVQEERALATSAARRTSSTVSAGVGCPRARPA